MGQNQCGFLHLSSISNIFRLKLIPKLFLIQHYRCSKAALFLLIYRKSANNEEQKYDRQLWVVGLLLKASLTALLGTPQGSLPTSLCNRFIMDWPSTQTLEGLKTFSSVRCWGCLKHGIYIVVSKKHAMRLSFSRVFFFKTSHHNHFIWFILDKGTTICHKTDIFYVQNIMMKFGLNSNILRFVLDC